MVDLSSLNLFRIPDMIKLGFASRYVKKDLKPYIDNKNIEFAGESVNHETSLVAALKIMRAFYSSLPITVRTFREDTFDQYIKFIAHSVYVSDLINEAVEHFKLDPKYDSIESILKQINNVQVKENEDIKYTKMSKLCEGHFNEASNLRECLEIDEEDYLNKIKHGLEYSRDEREFSKRFNEKDFEYVKEKLDIWDDTEELEKLTESRVGFIFSYCVDTFYELFVDNRYNREDLSNWASNISNASQEGIDDTYDLINDIKELKPTPLVINILNIYIASDSRKMTPEIIREGLEQTRDEINDYLRNARIDKLPGMMKYITEYSNSVINDTFTKMIGSNLNLECDVFNKKTRYLELYDYVNEK
jgi:hypothetical protein